MSANKDHDTSLVQFRSPKEKQGAMVEITKQVRMSCDHDEQYISDPSDDEE
jgi:hypothetical protein